MLKSSRSKCKGGFFLWAEEAEAEALITARIIRAVIRIPEVHHTDLPGLHIHIIQAARLTGRIVTAVTAEEAAAAVAAAALYSVWASLS